MLYKRFTYGVTHLDSAVLVMCLGGQESDALVELVRDRRELVVRGSNADEARIMRSRKSDLAVPSVAVLGVSIAVGGGARSESESRQSGGRAHIGLGF